MKGVCESGLNMTNDSSVYICTEVMFMLHSSEKDKIRFLSTGFGGKVSDSPEDGSAPDTVVLIPVII